MDRTGDITTSPPLLALGDADAARCADGFCAVPAAPQEEQEEEVTDAD
ncbi:MAG TPA: hypothetical protein VFQ68_33290 [Streptosporangiaceae bacterium]|nr:hypothetical protein [Streptosporangiaceae bacterium]